MRYQDVKNERQKAFNALPIKFAFSDEQFEKGMKEFGLSPDDVDQVCGVVGGGFMLKKDVHLLHELLEKPDPIPEMMNDKDFAIDAFYCEMCNHEYGINNQGDFDVCGCFGDIEWGGGMMFYDDYLKKMGYSDDVVDSYRAAKRKYFRAAEENEWF